MNSTALKKSCYIILYIILIHKNSNIQCLQNYYEYLLEF